MSLSDPYLIPGTDVLRNKLGILDPDRLDLEIDDISHRRRLLSVQRGAARPTVACRDGPERLLVDEGDLVSFHVDEVARFENGGRSDR